MKKNATNRLVLLALVVSTTTTLLVSATYNVEVKVGDWAKYDIWAWKASKNETEEWMEPLINQTNNILWINMTVKETASSGTIKISETIQFKNGIANITSYIGSPKDTPSNLKYWITSGGLEEGDWISTEASVENFTVYDTRLDEYANATRRVTHGFLKKRSGESPPQMAEYFWDQETGILCSCLYTYQGSKPQYTVFVEIRMMETNVWEPESDSGNSWWPAIIVALILVTAVFLLIKRKQGTTKKKRPRH
jgi:hypothetical protein